MRWPGDLALNSGPDSLFVVILLFVTSSLLCYFWLLIFNRKNEVYSRCRRLFGRTRSGFSDHEELEKVTIIACDT